MNEEKRQTGKHALQMYVKRKRYVPLAAFVDTLLKEIDWLEEALETKVHSVHEQNLWLCYRERRNGG